MMIMINAPSSAFDGAALPNSLNDKTFPLARISRMTVVFPDFPKQQPFEMANIREVHLIPDKPLRIEIQEAGGLSNVRLQGIVSEFRIHAGGIWRDVRRTQFDRLMASRSGIWLILGGWLLLTGIGWFKIYQALK